MTEVVKAHTESFLLVNFCTTLEVKSPPWHNEFRDVVILSLLVLNQF